MCGLVGIAGDLEFKDEATIKRLLVYDFFRGPDSTGMATVKKTNDVLIAKVASHPLDLFDMKTFDKALQGFGSKLLLGHNRAATKGKVNAINAHPFQCGHIVGAHNGTLDRKSWTRLEEAIGFETEVDSLAIFEAIREIGIEATVALLEEGRHPQEGAWALVWYDLKDNTLNLLRNKHRPLWYSWAKDFKKFLWASEWPMIDAAIKLAQQNHTYDLFTSTEGYKFWECKSDWWYRIDLEELISGSFSEKPKVRVKELKGREPAPVAIAAGDSNFPQRRAWNATSTTTSHGSTSADTNKVPTVLDLIGTQGSPLSSFMDKDRFLDIAKYGCSWCQADVDFYDVGVTIYEAEGMVLCPVCSGNKSDQTRIFVDPYDMMSYVEEIAAKTGTK